MRILIVDDHAVVRQGIKQIITDMDGPVEVSEAGNGSDAVRMLRDGEWDMVLLDINLPGKNGIEVLKQIKGEWKKLPVLMLSMYSEDQYAMRAIRSGASGYMTKETAPDELLNAINKVMRGGRYISAAVAEKLVFDQDDNGDELPHHELSDREYEVLRLIATGLSSKEIAAELVVAPSTIKTHIKHLYGKLDARNRAQAILRAQERGLL